MSRHLKTLADAGWVTSRRDGTSRSTGLAATLEPAAGGCGGWSASRRARPPRRAGRRRRAGRAERGARSRRGSSRPARAVGPPPRRALRRSSSTLAALAMLDARLRGRRSRLRHRPVQRAGGPVRPPGHRRRRLGRHARRPRAAAGRPRPTSSCARRARIAPGRRPQLDIAVLALVLRHVPDPGGSSRKRRACCARRPGAGRGHAAPRSQRLPAADGPRVARVLRAAGPPMARCRRLHRRAFRRPDRRAAAKGPPLFRAVARRPPAGARAGPRPRATVRHRARTGERHGNRDRPTRSTPPAPPAARPSR